MTILRTPSTTSTETDDLLESLAQHRWFLRFAVRGLTDEQARRRTTASALHLAGLIKHVAETEARWADFCVRGAAAFAGAEWVGESDVAADDAAEHPEFTPGPDQTLATLLGRYEEVAEQTDGVVRALPDLGTTHDLPVTPWWPEGGCWSARRALLHVLAETAQHAGHADIIRESLDGQLTMG